MGFFRRIGNAMARFMYGRNGMDHLNRALLWVYLLFWLLGSIAASVLKMKLITMVVDIVIWILMLVIFFRMFSKNLYKRREENQRYLMKTSGMRNKLAGAKQRHADKTHKYFTCGACKTICRVPVGKGKVVITCPRCGSRIEGKT